MICPRCRASMVENSYLPDGEMCNRCGLIVTYDDDGRISGTNETCGRTYILDGATGGAARGHRQTVGKSLKPRSKSTTQENQRGVSQHSYRD